MAERWVPVPGFSDYEVSDEGRILSRHRNRRKPRLIGHVGPRGYRAVMLYRDGICYRFLVHQIVLWAFVGPGGPGQETLHLNDRKTDNRLVNLRWGTSAENKAMLPKPTLCHKGHSLAEHAYRDPRGRRQCRICRRETVRRWKALRRAG